MAEPAAPRESRPRPLLALASAAVLAAAGAVIIVQPEPVSSAVQAAQTQATPGPLSRFCPGPLTLPDGALPTGGDAELGVTAPATAVGASTVSLEPDSGLLYGSTEGSETLRDPASGSVRTPSITALDDEDTRISTTAEHSDLGASVQTLADLGKRPHMVTGTATNGPPITDVVQSTATTTGDYRSLAATRCTAPTTQAQFLGISTQRGDSAALVLRNVSQRPATASVQIWTAEGPAAMEGRSRVVVPPGEEERVLLESVVGAEDDIGVRVDVLGAPLITTVQTTSRDGLTPTGAEIIPSLPEPRSDQVLPGVHVTDGSPRLVLLNPGRSDTTVDAEIVGPKGAVDVPAARGIDVAAGTVASVPLDGLTPANYSVRLTADTPLSAAVTFGVTGRDLPGDTIGAPVDTAVVQTAPDLLNGAVIAIPPGGTDGRLVVDPQGADTLQVIPLRTDGTAGKPVEVSLPENTATTLNAKQLGVDANTAGLVLVPGAQPVHAAWVQLMADGAGGNLVSVLPVPSPSVAERGAEVSLAQ